MKILVREFADKVYEWVEAEYNGTNFVIDGSIVKETNIVSVDEDNRSNYVRCEVCGEMFEKGSPKIEEHKSKYSSYHGCFGCPYIREDNTKYLNSEYVLQVDGTFAAKKSYSTQLLCGASWYRTPPIISDDARRGCSFRGCINADMVPIEDIFMTHPGIFDDIITVDKIVDAGYKDANRYGDKTTYQLKGRNNIWAHVNKINIVDYFVLHYKNYTYTLFYSKKYNEFYVPSRGNKNYAKWTPAYVPEATVEYVKKIVASLYK